MSTQHHHRHHHHHANGSNVAAEDGSIQLLAYQIYQEKGGYALDNWLEAERTVKNGH
jgi:hypothetical protein